jgi:hypothetical protein
VALDPNIDPVLAAQLYGERVPSLADMAPPPSTVNPWSWVPPHWDDPPVEQLAPDALVPGMPAAELAAAPEPVEVGPPPGDLAPPAPIPLPPPIDTLPSMRPPPELPPAAPALRVPGMDAAERVAGAARSLPDNPLEYADPEMRQRAVNALAMENPAAFAELMLRHTDEREKHIAARRAEIINRDYDQQVANLKARQEADRVTQQKTEELLASADRIFSTKIDPTGGVTGVRRLAGVAQAVIGGLIQGRTGSARNAGLDAFVDTINRGIESQKADLENQRAGLQMRRSALADEFRRHGDMFLAQEAVRLAALKHADELLATEQQNFDPQGTQALKIAAVRAGIGAEQQKGLQAFQDKNREFKLKAIEQDRKNRETEAKIALDRANAAKAYSDAAATKADKTVYSPEQLKAINTVNGVAPPVPSIPMSQADYAKWLNTQKVGEEYRADATRNSPEDRARRFGVGGFVTSDGAPALFRTEEFAGKLAKSKGAVDSASRLIDKMLLARKKYGWSTDLLKSPEWREMQANFTQLNLEKKDADGLGVIAGPDLVLLHGSLGTSDVTEVRDPTPGLLAARRNMIDKVNAQADAEFVPTGGRTLKRWEPPPPDTEAAKETPEQAHLQALLQAPDGAPATRFVRDYARAVRDAKSGLSPEEARAFGPHVTEERPGIGGVGADAYSTIDLPPAQQAVLDAVKQRFDPGAAIWQQDEIARLAAVASGPASDPEAKEARATLDKIAERGQTGRLRELAKSALEAAGRAR